MPTYRVLTVFTTSVCLGLFACAERASSTSPSPASTRTSASYAEPASPGGRGGPRGNDGRMYDTATVETIRGQAVRMEHIGNGVHVIMKTEAGETIPVHLGPAWFVEDQALVIQPGDTLEVTGSRVRFDGAPALIARRVVKGENELVLRDEAGVPVWSAGRRAGAPPATAESDGTGESAPPERKSDMSILNENEQQALRDALDDEYRAWARYDQVIRDFGPELPFINIRDAEARHIEALQMLFQRHGVEIPENTWPGRVPRYTSTREACEASAEAEIANVALYDRLMQNTSRQDILAVFGNLQRASQEQHLPAFQRCATRGAGRGRYMR